MGPNCTRFADGSNPNLFAVRMSPGAAYVTAGELKMRAMRRQTTSKAMTCAYDSVIVLPAWFSDINEDVLEIEQ